MSGSTNDTIIPNNNSNNNKEDSLDHQNRIDQSRNESVDLDFSNESDLQDCLAPTQEGEHETITIDDAIERLGYGVFQRKILAAAGCCFAADSMEVLLLTFLSVVLKVQWSLTQNETSAITSLVFLGAMIGTLVLGPAGDMIGRRPIFLVTATIISVFGFGTAAVQDYRTMLAVRFMVGFGVGGLTVPFDVLAEFMPLSDRGSNLLLVEYFWVAGTICVPIVAYFSLEHNSDHSNSSWRYFVTLCAIPCLFATLLGSLYVPESPRWLLSQGRYQDAMTILRKAATTNGLDPKTVFPPGLVVVLDDVGSSNNYQKKGFLHLLSQKWRRVTLTLWGTWSGLALLYYGTIIIITKVFASGTIKSASHSASDQVVSDDTNGSYNFDYLAIFVSATAEFAGTTIMILAIDRIGRIPIQVLSYLLGGISVFTFCFIASSPQATKDNGDDDVRNIYRIILIVVSFLARMFFMSASCATWVSTAELLPTEIRTTGHSAANAIARISGACSPFLIRSNSNETNESPSYTHTAWIILVISIVTSFLTWMLPETKGRSMGSTTSAVTLNPQL